MTNYINPFKVAFLSLCLLSGCSNNPTVHLYKRYLTSEQTMALVERLEQKGVDVVTNEFSMPTKVSQTSILYSPLISDRSVITKVTDEVEASGFSVSETSPLFSGNHWYTKNSLALFVVPEGSGQLNSKHPIALMQEFSSQDCPSEIKLQLDEQGYFSYYIDQVEKLTGRWGMTSFPYLLLENSVRHISIYFEVKRSVIRDQVSEVELLTLTPLNNSNIVKPCSVTFGLRV